MRKGVNKKLCSYEWRKRPG